MLRAIGRMSPGWPSSLWVERLRTYALEHFGDDLQHVCRRKSPQRFRADVAQRAEAQVKRRGGKLIWSFNDYYDVIPSLRPEYILNGHSERFRHLPEGLCPLRRIFGAFDALIGERGKHDIGCHGRFSLTVELADVVASPTEGALTTNLLSCSLSGASMSELLAQSGQRTED